MATTPNATNIGEVPRNPGSMQQYTIDSLFPQHNAAPTGAGAGHWDYPDYAGLLNKWMQPYQQQYEGNIQALKAQTDTNTQLANDRYSQGPTSTLARLAQQEQYGTYQHGQNAEVAAHQHTLNLMNLTNALAARGILSSGEKDFQNAEEAFRYGHLTDAENKAYAQQQFGVQTGRADAGNQLLDYLRGVQQAFADAQRQGLDQLAQQRQSVAETLSQIYQPSWVDESAGANGGGQGVQAANAGYGYPVSPVGFNPGATPMGNAIIDQVNAGNPLFQLNQPVQSYVGAGFNPGLNQGAAPYIRPPHGLPEGY